MTSTSFKLDSGRVVSIETVSIRNAYENTLIGHPDRLAAEIWQATPRQLEQEFGPGVIILKPLGTRLPTYRFVAVLHSSSLPAAVPQDISYMTICWFQGDLNVNLVEAVRHIIKDLQWEKYAKNYSY
jgi:hypothetical protein